VAHRECRVCTALDMNQLAELDAILSDPTTWPSTIWTIFRPPAGRLPMSYRRFGAIRMGRMWLDDHGFDAIADGSLRSHYRFDVPLVNVDVEDLVERGLIERGSTVVAAPLIFDPQAYLGFYSRGIKLGNTALELLESRIAALVEKGKGEDVPWLWIKAAMELGSKLAASQAAIRAAGKQMGNSDEDDGDAFRAGAAGGELPSPRMGHSRIRTVDGVARPVHDEGPADRAEYSERSAQEGGRGL
jgi:hypothetical protein